MKYHNSRWHLTKSERMSDKTLRHIIELERSELTPIDETNYHLFYFDGEFGNDQNDGKTSDTAKKTLNEAMRIIKEVSKVKLLFKRGTTFEGNFEIKDYWASEEYPLIIDAYGNGARYPKFIGNQSVIHIMGSNVRVFNIEVTGVTATRGIHITPITTGALKNVVIANCYVHDINFNWDHKKDSYYKDPDTIELEKVCPEYEEDGVTKGRYHYRWNGGIIAHNEIGPSWFENVWFINNIIKNVARTGLTLYNKWTDKPGVGYGYNKWVGYHFENDITTGLGYFVSKNIYCIDNYVETVGGDGIVMSSANNVLMRGNICYYANYLGRKGYWNGGIWVYNVSNCLFEYNEAAYTYKRHGSEDAQGFDIDNACQNVLMRYNYAHHNEGGGLLCCNLKTGFVLRDEKGEVILNDGTETIIKETGRWFNNYIYKNYFRNNGIPTDSYRSAFLTIAREVTYSTFKNNIVVLSPEIHAQSIINTEDMQTHSYELDFVNNVFYASKKTGATFTIPMMHTSRFQNNKYHLIDSIDSEQSGEKLITLQEFIGNLIDIPNRDIFDRHNKAQENLKNFMSYISKGGFIS